MDIIKFNLAADQLSKDSYIAGGIIFVLVFCMQSESIEIACMQWHDMLRLLYALHS